MWNGDKIVVMGVTIEPPYQPESIKSREDNKALNHIRKIVSIYNFCICTFIIHIIILLLFIIPG